METVKSIFKFVFALICGIAVGITIVALVITLFTDTTLSQFYHKFISTDILEILEASFVGISAFLISLTLLVTVHEAGHLICGLLSGYKFVSFRIFNFTFVKINGKVRIKRFSIAGTGGQCLLTPPDLPLEKIPTGWYNAGGVLANILFLLPAIPLMYLNLNPFVKEAALIYILTDLLLIVFNGIPMQLGGVSNDARNIIMLQKDLKSKTALVNQLKTNALIQNGVRPKDMPDDLFETEGEIDYKKPLEVSIPLMYASKLIDEYKYEEALKKFEVLYRHKDSIMPLYVKEIECELVFLYLITGNTHAAAALIEKTKDLQAYIRKYSKVMSSKERILCAMALFIDKDKEKAGKIYKDLDARKENYLLQGEVKSDLAIMESMLSDGTLNNSSDTVSDS